MSRRWTKYENAINELPGIHGFSARIRDYSRDRAEVCLDEDWGGPSTCYCLGKKTLRDEIKSYYPDGWSDESGVSINEFVEWLRETAGGC